MSVGRILSPINKSNWSLELPRQHGAVLVLAMSSLIALIISQSIETAVGQVVLWVMLLSLQKPRQLLLVSILGAAVLYVLSGYPAALWIAAVWSGKRVVYPHSSGTGLWWRELLALTGLAISPLVFSYLATGDLYLHLTMVITLLASNYCSVALIRGARKDTRVTPVPAALLSLSAWFYLTFLNEYVAACGMVPYVVQSVWLVNQPNVSFKKLGQAQLPCLIWIFITLVFGFILT